MFTCFLTLNLSVSNDNRVRVALQKGFGDQHFCPDWAQHPYMPVANNPGSYIPHLSNVQSYQTFESLLNLNIILILPRLSWFLLNPSILLVLLNNCTVFFDPEANSWRKGALSRNPHMQTDSKHIHECNHPDRSPKICFQTNFGTVNVNSHNTHSFQMDNCGNRNQCWSLLLLISCCSHSSESIY